MNESSETSFSFLAEKVLGELREVLAGVDISGVAELVGAIRSAQRIVVYGAGRMGIVSSAFAMRLMQLGFNCHVLTEATTPAVGAKDLVILASFSGETRTVKEVASIAKETGARIAVITARPESEAGRLADLRVRVPAPEKSGNAIGVPSIQPMTTLADQSLMVLFDVIVMQLMLLTGQTEQDLWARHRNLE